MIIDVSVASLTGVDATYGLYRVSENFMENPKSRVVVG